MNCIMESAGADAAAGGSTQLLPRSGPVLIVDDDPTDAMQTEWVLAELQPKFPVQIVTSGEDLVAYLQGESLYKDRTDYPYPAMILLDLKMPKMDGFEVLEWLKHSPVHLDVPVIVLSGLAHMAEQVTRAYQLGAHSFLPKPVQQQDIEGILSVLKISI